MDFETGRNITHENVDASGTEVSSFRSTGRSARRLELLVSVNASQWRICSTPMITGWQLGCHASCC
jgi:hypothetical protein